MAIIVMVGWEMFNSMHAFNAYFNNDCQCLMSPCVRTACLSKAQSNFVGTFLHTVMPIWASQFEIIGPLW